MDLDQETTELLYPVYDEDPLEVKNSDDEYDMEATEVRTLFICNAWVWINEIEELDPESMWIWKYQV